MLCFPNIVLRRSNTTNISSSGSRFADRSLEVDQARKAELVSKIEQLEIGEEAGAVEAQFYELFTERKGSEEVKSALGSARSRIKTEKVRIEKACVVHAMVTSVCNVLLPTSPPFLTS